jgi:YggT family protein
MWDYSRILGRGKGMLLASLLQPGISLYEENKQSSYNNTAMNLPSIIHLLFTTYTVLLFLRIVSFWFPAWQHHQFVRFLSFYTDPYLNIFRRLIPPLGGALDLSPILAFFVLRILELLLLSFFQ